MTYLFVLAISTAFGQINHFTEFKQALKNADKAYFLESEVEDLNKSIHKINKLEYLQTLVLKDNYLTALPKEIEGLKSLIKLSISKNPISYIPTEIGYMKSLMYLSLSDTKLDSLPSSIGYLKNLKTINIVDNASDSFKIPQSITKLQNLSQLHIENTSLVLPQNLSGFPSLKKLKFYNCKLTTIPNGISSMSQLTHLTLDNNQLTVFPEEITKLYNLEHLSLRNNKLEKINENISNLTKLRYLDLRGNSINDYQLDILKALLPNCDILTDSKK